MTTVLLPYPVSTNELWRMAGRKMVLSKEAAAWKKAAAWTAHIAGMRPIDGDVSVKVVLHPKIKANGTANPQRPDLDNALKCCLDALQGIGYANDRQIEDLHATVGAAIKDGGIAVTVEKFG